jgi:hypothetical protein
MALELNSFEEYHISILCAGLIIGKDSPDLAGQVLRAIKN